MPIGIFPEEAAAAPGVAGDAAGLVDLQQDRVVVAVKADFQHFLGVAGFLALVPQLAPRTRPIHGFASFHRQLQRFAIHPGEHQHIAARRILGDDRGEALLVPFDIVQPVRAVAHSLTSMPCARMYSLAWRTVYSP